MTTARTGPDPQMLLGELIRMVRTDDLDASRERLAGLDPDVIGALIAAARLHGVEAWMAACVPSAAGWSELADQRRRFLAAQARSRAAARALGERLDQHGCRWAVLKGLTIADSAYPRSDLRHSVDIDVLVSPAVFQSVVEALLSDGYRIVDVNWPLLAERMPGQLRLRAPNGTLIDLHWHLLNQPVLRGAFRLPTEELLRRSGPRTPHGLPALDATDQLLHTGLHAALGGANRLGWLVDIDRLVRAQDTDWHSLTLRARASGTGRPQAVALARTRSVLHTPIPEPVLRELAGGRLSMLLLRTVDVRSPLTVDPQRPRLSRAFARSARGGWWSSQTELARHGFGWLRSKRRGADRADSWLDPTSETSALHPVVDDGARARYFAAVASTRDGSASAVHS